jgi:MoxR-like ATPase
MKVKFYRKKEKAPIKGKLEKSVSRLNAMINQVSTVILERADELIALKLGLIAREHVMLEGTHGIAKSRLAKEVSDRIIGATVFKKQLTSTTQPDEILGCMNSQIYREKARWEYNIEGMLPDAHIAYLDEVYRGSRSLLPNMMQILNERTFENNLTTVRCPLITAIGTTNFTITDEELLPFHDRWLIKSMVKPLSTSSARLKMIQLDMLYRQGKNPFDTDANVSLDDLNLLSQSLSEVEIPEQMLELYEELVRMYVAKFDGRIFISDRRLCQTLKLVQAAYLADEDKGETFNESYLNCAQYGLCVLNVEEQLQAFNEIFDRVVGTYVRADFANRKMSKVEAIVTKLAAEFDDNMESAEATEMFKKASRYLFGLNNPTPEFPEPSGGEGLEKYKKSISTLESLIASLRPIVEASIRNEIESELA